MSTTTNILRYESLLRGAFVALCIGVAASASAQLTTSPQTDLVELANTITGDGVQISNPVITCHSEGYGQFTYTGSALGIQEGIILTSGRRVEAVGPNDVENKSFQQNTNGSSILNVVTGRTTRDACMFEFDIIPSGDSLKFNFALGSEEYNEWVGSQYNDVFGFFISGPGITGDPGIGNDHNIALIPNTNQPVTINNVNNGSNSQYYFDNAGGQHIQYDGLTRGLSARTQVQPCTSYHLKLIVADASDRKFDSGVFIERIQSNNISMALVTTTGGPDLVEGCNNGFVRFTRGAVRPTPLTLEYYLQGTATNGVDYAAIGNPDPGVPKFVTIPADQASVDVPVDPVADGIAEPTESLLFILGNPYCVGAPLDTLVVSLVDSLVSSLSPAGPINICPGGSVQFQASGGTTYAWSPAAGLSATNIANPIATPSATTNYTVVISQGTCSRTISRLVRVSNATLSATITRPLCSGASNGALNLSVSGGTAPFSFTWTGPNGFTASSEDLVNVGAGTYNVTVTDGSGCTRTQSFNISEPAALSAMVSPSILPFGENVACFGGTTGTLNLNLTGGTAPFGFAWTGPSGFTSNAQNLSALRAGAYSVTITDAGGCTTTAAYTMTQPTAIGAGVTGIQHVACFGNNIGSATATNTGGTPPFSYTWNTTPAQTTATATGLAPGAWTVTITDGYGCTSTAVATINGPAQALGSTVGSTTHVTCFGAATGSTTVSATGGTSPYNYSWNTTPAQSTATATALPAGTWTCTITDNNGCTTTRNVTINQPAAALTGNVSAQTNVLCFGNSTGSALVGASGGTAPYSYSWNTTPVRTTAVVTALPAGTWSCTVTDAGGCAITVPVTITQPSAALALALDAPVNVLCFGNNTGSATVIASGGTAPYNYAWNTSPVQTTATANGLVAGNYSCTVTDANGCTSLQAVLITQPAAALASSVNAQTNVLCFGGNNGSATVAASGGTAPYTYNWNTTPVQNSATASNLSAGNWACTITDANGCTVLRNVSISQPAAALSAALSAQTNVLCFGNSTGTATMNATGGTAPYTFVWNTTPVQNTASATGLSAGTWTCTITDANGCSVTRTATITQPAAGLSAHLDAHIDVLCFGNSTGSATVSVSGGTAPYSYSWNTTPVQTTAMATNLAAGSRTCTITDASGCSTTLDVTITQPAAALNATLGTRTNVLCFGNSTGSATIDVSGGSAPYTYAWNTTPVQNSATAIGLPAGTWTCTVTDANGCTRTRNVVITQPSAALASSLSAQTNVLCFGNNSGNATVSVTGGTTPYTYSWNTTPAQSTATASNLQAGMWTCTITDGNGCTSTSQVSITQPASALTSSLSGQVNVLCHGASTGSGTVVASGGTAPYTYSWNTTPVQTTATATNLIAGTRICTITDVNGCTSTTSVTITQPAAAINITGTVSPATCGGAADGAVDATVSGGSTPYTVAWSGPNGFTSSNTDISAMEAGVYQLNITDANGCTASSSFNVGQPGVFTISATTSDYNGFEVSCPGASDGSIAQTISGGTAPYSHSWSGPDGYTSSDEDISVLASGTYTYIVIDDNGCSTSATYSMETPPALSASLSSPVLDGAWNIACDGHMSGSIDAGIVGGVSPVTVNWSGPDGFSSNDEDLSALGAGTYTLTMIDANGCRMTDAITLTAPPVLTATGTMINGVDCFNANNGIAQTTVAGGTAPYSYSWNTTPAQITSNATDLPIGTWTCTVTDANGCSTTANT
ncbi:MAG: SprB repeat-containing protein, partial [Flavobacteriales bacterium]|nr:SprB repeat-containing protein [Flavobacteriales bacterium]